MFGQFGCAWSPISRSLQVFFAMSKWSPRTNAGKQTETVIMTSSYLWSCEPERRTLAQYESSPWCRHEEGRGRSADQSRATWSGCPKNSIRKVWWWRHHNHRTLFFSFASFGSHGTHLSVIGSETLHERLLSHHGVTMTSSLTPRLPRGYHPRQAQRPLRESLRPSRRRDRAAG